MLFVLNTDKTKGICTCPEAARVDAFKEQENRNYDAGQLLSSSQRNTALNKPDLQALSTSKNKEKRTYLAGRFFYNGWRDKCLDEPVSLDASTSNNSSAVSTELLVPDTFVTRKYLRRCVKRNDDLHCKEINELRYEKEALKATI